MLCVCATKIGRGDSISKNHQLTNLNKCGKFHACIRNSTILALSRLAIISAFQRTGKVPINRGKICPVKVLPATIYPKTETENQPSDSKCGEQFLDNLKITTVKESTKPKRKALPTIIGNLSDSKNQEILQTTSCKKALKLNTPIPAPFPSTSTSNKENSHPLLLISLHLKMKWT